MWNVSQASRGGDLKTPSCMPVIRIREGFETVLEPPSGSTRLPRVIIAFGYQLSNVFGSTGVLSLLPPKCKNESQDFACHCQWFVQPFFKKKKSILNLKLIEV